MSPGTTPPLAISARVTQLVRQLTEMTDELKHVADDHHKLLCKVAHEKPMIDALKEADLYNPALFDTEHQLELVESPRP